MADTAGPLPKRRRTDDRGPTTISPEQIRQTNATLNHFTGQRQNRWMQGYTVNAAANSGAAGVNRQTASVSITPAISRPANTNHGERSRGGGAMSAGEARENLQQPTPAEGAMGESRGRSRTIVDYQTPSLSSAPSSLFPSTADKATGDHNPGLPSPAPSDENTNSPVITNNMEPAKRGRGRPRNNPAPVQPANSQTSFQAGANLQPREQQRQASTIDLETQTMYRPPSVSTPHGHGQPSVPSPQTPAAVAPNTHHAAAAVFNPAALQARIESFKSSHVSANQSPHVDRGRLSLLAEAASQQPDLFYILLSQVHALMECQPQSLPEAIRGLSSDSWKNLDDLVCSNKAVSRRLLVWLADFPTPITRVYSDPILSQFYGPYLTAIANFLRDLPAQWDVLVGQCRQVNAPPLVQDLNFILRLNSSVLQTVAFRAIGRMIYPASNDTYVLEQLEVLHRFDQQAWARGHLRQPAERIAAYDAFNRVRDAWRQWHVALEEHDARQKHLAPEQRTAFQRFDMGSWLPGVTWFFQARQAPAPVERAMRTPHLNNAPVPSNPPFFRPQLQQQQQHSTLVPLQQPQQQTSGSTGQGTARFNTFTEYFHSLSQQPNMPARQTPISNGVTMPPHPSPHGARGLAFPHDQDPQRSQPTEPNPSRSALHQAHLRSPVSVPQKIGEAAPQLYQYVCKWALAPTRLTKDPINVLTFDLPDAEFAKIPTRIPSSNQGAPPDQHLSESSQTYRLRCCAISSRGFRSESEWVLAESRWPDELYLQFNGNILEPRRPLHHKKCLPIDLTHLMKPGVNTLQAGINRTSTDKRSFDFALAVEVVGAVSHSTLTSNLQSKQIVSVAETKTSIQKALGGAGGDEDDDDDIAITSTSMTIKLFDPFSGSKIFDTPVRGANCPHKDCFDLETFLSQCKRDKPGYPTIVDCWRCPLCRGDVRPSMLVRDEWLVEVRKTLEAQGKLDTRAIFVEADGSWKPKLEEKTGVRSASLEREERAANEVAPAPKRVVEVIELD